MHISDLAHIKSLEKLTDQPCIYFLCLHDQIVYVGKTINLSVRMINHKSCKHFDSVYYIRLDHYSATHIDLIEQYFIDLCSPKLNKKNKKIEISDTGLLIELLTKLGVL